MAALRRTKDGRMLCEAHAYTGAPAWHTPGCEACEAARARGIIRPDATGVSVSKRRARGLSMRVIGSTPEQREAARKKAKATMAGERA
jgi:hypothetical protein